MGEQMKKEKVDQDEQGQTMEDMYGLRWIMADKGAQGWTRVDKHSKRGQRWTKGAKR